MRYFKGNLHMHTTRSDGRRSPEDAISLYRDHGYDFVALTDHYVYGAEQTADRGGTLVISGAEYDHGTEVLGGVYHIVGLGMERDPGLSREPQKPEPQVMIDAIHAAGGLAVLAHPAWSLNAPSEILKLRGIDMLEIYNTVSGLPWNCRPESGVIADLLAVRGLTPPLIAVDDAHFYAGDECRSWIMVRAQELTSSAILGAVMRGDYFATQGPEFEYRLEMRPDGSGVLTVESTPVESVWFMTDRPYEPDRSVSGHGITRAVYEVKPCDGFVRIEMCDADGRRAWSGYLVVRPTR